MNLSRIIAIVGALLIATSAQAGQYTGLVRKLMVNPNSLGSPVRMSIEVTSGSTSCAAPTWMAYENADTGIGKVWTAMLLAAYHAGKTVTIVGKGTCDPHGVEIIDYISVQ